MGMSWEQYWDESSFLAVVYREAYMLKRKLENEQAWLQGLYFYDAIEVALANAFSKKGSKKHEYFTRPIDIFPLTEEEKKVREQEELDKIQKTLEAMRDAQQLRKKQKGG